jgi:hypothetical protein
MDELGRTNYLWAIDAEHNIRRVDSMEEWCRYYSANGDKNRIVAQTEEGEILISTIFTGLNRNWLRPDEPPVLFETMVFGGEFSEVTVRYSTYEEALQGHSIMVSAVLKKETSDEKTGTSGDAPM